MSPTPYTISVIIPVFNGAATIARCLDSILAQTLPPDEIIVIDDGSNDTTAAIVKNYPAPVHYIYQPNQGVSVARNSGIRAAHSEWIAFQDADDIWLPDKLQKQMALLERHPQLRWCISRLTIHPAGGSVSPELVEKMLNGKEYLDNFFTALPIRSWAYSIVLIVHRSLFSKAGLFRTNQSYSEELDLYIRIAYFAPQLGFVNEPLAVYYLDQPQNASARSLNWRVCQLLALYRRHWLLASKYGRNLSHIRSFIAKWSGILTYQCWIDHDITSIRHLNRHAAFALPWYYKLIIFLLICLPVDLWADHNLNLKCFGKTLTLNFRKWVSYLLHSEDRKSLARIYL